MPLYDYQCRSCGDTKEVFLRLHERETTVQCPICLCAMKRLMSAARIQMDYPGYNCPVTGNWIEGRRAHRANLEKHGCRILETGEREMNEKRKRQSEEALLDRIAETAAREVARMPAAKQSKLCQEMEHGASISVERR